LNRLLVSLQRQPVKQKTPEQITEVLSSEKPAEESKK
jgi:hypothetical protein